MRLGVYEVLGPLGAGGMGEVYRARDTRLSWTSPVSPDGKSVVGIHADKMLLVPLDGVGEGRVVGGLASPADRVIQWSHDSRALYVHRAAQRPLQISLLDLETGQRRLWKEIALEASLGAMQVRVTPDGRTWVYSGRRVLSELYLVEGLR